MNSSLNAVVGLRSRSAVRAAVRTALALAVVAAGLPAVTAQAAASEEGITELDEVVVTGTAIRRIEGESSLPVQVFSAADIEEIGVTSVTDLVQRLPSLQGGTVEAESIGGSTFGFAGASVHNIGETRTLVLLNGRRLAQFGGQTLTGFAAGMDLNAIPIASIERVEVLTEGASALYGSDAIAGVVNFITRRNVQGFEVGVDYHAPRKAGEELGLTLSGGVGDLDADGWNFFGTFGMQKRNELRSVDRSFADSAIVNFDYAGARWTFFNGSPSNIPANALTDAGDITSIDFLADGVCPPDSAPVDDGCYFDHVRYIQIYPERERYTATASLEARLNDSATFFVDGLWSRTTQLSKTAPVPGQVPIAAGSPLFDQYLAPVVDGNGDPLYTEDTVAFYRVMDLGNRIGDDQADFYNVSAGFRGEFTSWTYDAALSHSESDVKGDIAGYPGGNAFNNLLQTGLIDPFVAPGMQSEAGFEALQAINYKGYWEGGTSRLLTAQAQASRTLFDLPNDTPVLFAAGLGWSREKFWSKPSEFAQGNLEDPVAGTPAVGGPGTGDQRFGDAGTQTPYFADRNVWSAFAEVSVQPVDWLELTGALRYDDYNDVGDTTNFKLAFSLTPVEQLLIRGSYGTGFKAPTVPQINATRRSYGVTSDTWDCNAEMVAIAADLGAICRPPQSQYDVFAAGNAELVAEESRNVTVGAVFQATPAISLGADFWWVGIKDAFGILAEDSVFNNPNQYLEAWTTYTDPVTLETYIAFDNSNRNTGKEYYSGIDFNLLGDWDTPVGALRSQLIATRMLTSKVQLERDGPYFENIGDYSDDLGEPTFKWTARLVNSLDMGSWTHALTLNYKSGYTDTETTVDGINEDGSFNGEVLDVRLDVDAYATFDWQSRWEVTDQLDINLGVLNLFDKDPPRSLTSANFQVGYDARFYDPRGRTLYGSVAYRF
jgi:iron complex outermembrane receptor protein